MDAVDNMTSSVTRMASNVWAFLQGAEWPIASELSTAFYTDSSQLSNLRENPSGTEAGDSNQAEPEDRGAISSLPSAAENFPHIG